MVASYLSVSVRLAWEIVRPGGSQIGSQRHHPLLSKWVVAARCL
jgi:hypothetical protein